MSLFKISLNKSLNNLPATKRIAKFASIKFINKNWRDARVVERGGLENRCTE